VVGDAHLGAESAANEEAMLAFLDAVPSLGDALLVTGDLFDFWFTWPKTIPRHAIRTTAALVTLARRLPVHMVGGNHDRWGQGFWDREAGLRFDPHRLELDVAGRRVLAIHGDGMHREHLRANVLNQLINSPTVIRAVAALPSSFGFWAADLFQHDPSYAAAHPEIVEAGVARQRSLAERLMAEEPHLTAIVMGHTHRAVASELAPGRWYLNPGAWLDGHAYGLLDADGATLHHFR
jgi:UDP-2,3-diacylglucosamine hydrolase